MKIKKIFTACGIAAMMSLTFCFGCAPENSDVVKELKPGEITYENAVCEIIKGVENSGTVATAVASNGASVSYSMTEKDAEKLNTAFGGALTLVADGTVNGKYETVKKVKADVTASAEKCEPVTAEITFSVINPYLEYYDKILADARVDVPYATSVAFVQEEGVKYRLLGTLPEGLEWSEDGTITGTPTKVGRGTPFNVRASASGYTDTVREFVIDVVIDHKSETPSQIINFGSADGVKVLDDCYAGTQYVNQAGVAGNASALNGNNITYALKEGSRLPEGLTLYSNGAIIGLSNAIEECSFEVTASAAMCETLTRTFKLSSKAQRIRYEAISGVITKGEPTNFDIAKAVAGEGVTINYTVDETTKNEIAKYGLEVTSDGKVTGTPTVVKKSLSFEVYANAEGYTSQKATIFLKINEPLQAPAGGKFEAEYTDLSGKHGTGWSASPTGEDLIDTTFTSASNGAFINYMHNDTITLEFVIYADKAVSDAPLYISAGSEMGSVKFTPSSLGIYTYTGDKVNTETKKTVNYGSVTVEGGQTYTSFKEYKFGTVSLAEGWNVIQIAVHNNTLRDGLIGGPGLDYIRVDTSTTLKWVPYTYNMTRG